MHQTPNNQETSRRDFFKKAGERAVWAAPTVTVLLMATALPKKAIAGSGNCANPEPGTQGGRSPCAPFDFPNPK